MDLTTLTRTQRKVLDLLVQGNSNSEIGRLLSIAEKTVKAHITQLLKTTKCRNRLHLVARYYMLKPDCECPLRAKLSAVADICATDYGPAAVGRIADIVRGH